MAIPVHRDGQTAPILGGATAITKSDSTVYDPFLRGLYVGGSGDVAIVFGDGSQVTYVALAAGLIHPITNIKQILSTGTTATSIVSHKG